MGTHIAHSGSGCTQPVNSVINFSHQLQSTQLQAPPGSQPIARLRTAERSSDNCLLVVVVLSLFCFFSSSSKHPIRADTLRKRMMSVGGWLRVEEAVCNLRGNGAPGVASSARDRARKVCETSSSRPLLHSMRRSHGSTLLSFIVCDCLTVFRAAPRPCLTRRGCGCAFFARSEARAQTED